jgi:MOSC domain-containing protein YiiM
MSEGSVVEIYIGPEFEQPMRAVKSVNAVAGRGLEGDRYFHDGAPEGEHIPSEEVTLIEIEAIEAARRDHEADFGPEDTRRNLVTRGVTLKDLLGHRFSVGPVELEGLEPNPPCSHLERVSKKRILKPLINGGGIRARILTGGPIRTGDRIRVAPEAPERA